MTTPHVLVETMPAQPRDDELLKALLIVWVDPERLARLLLPSLRGGRVVEMCFDHGRKAFGLKFQHENLPWVAEGEVIPSLTLGPPP